MNFLAHAVLAGNRADVIAGSAAGDFVKGVLYDNQYPKDFLFGIRLHRRIDAFSNQEPNLRISANRLPASLRRIGPPCIDMLADHFLARAALRQPADYLPVIEDALTNTANPPQPTPPTHTLQTYEDRLHTLLLAHRGSTLTRGPAIFQPRQNNPIVQQLRRLWARQPRDRLCMRAAGACR